MNPKIKPINLHPFNITCPIKFIGWTLKYQTRKLYKRGLTSYVICHCFSIWCLSHNFLESACTNTFLLWTEKIDLNFMKYILPFSLSSRSQGHRSLPLQVVEFALIRSTVICSSIYRLVSFNSTFKYSTSFIIRLIFYYSLSSKNIHIKFSIF